VFSGCASASQAIGTMNEEIVEKPPASVVTNPSITADLTSAHPKRHGWYRSPVHISFVCTPGSAPLKDACPDPVTLRGSAAGRSVTRSVSAFDGGSATVTVSPINIDRVDPTLDVTGAKDGKLYRHGRRLHCDATDNLSGVRSCKITRHSHTRHGIRHVHWTATAKDRAGNTHTKDGHFRID
jgi:hypothetical protein